MQLLIAITGARRIVHAVMEPVVWQFLLCSRDRPGIAVTMSHTSAQYRLLSSTIHAKTVTKAAYQSLIRPWFAL